MPEASVITLSFNRPDALIRCLQSLARQTVEPDRFELIVVDVSDEPVSTIIAEFEASIRIRHVRTVNRGVAANRNAGVAAAAAPLLLFIDDDCRAEPDWLEGMIGCAWANPGALIGGGVVNSHPENAVATAGQVITEAVDAHFNVSDREPTFFPGLNFGVPRDGYLELGGCDESFGRLAAEDREFAARWRHSGRPMVAVPAARVLHEHRTDIAGFLRQYFNYGRGAWKYHECMKVQGTGMMSDAVRSHVGLIRRLAAPMSGLDLSMKLKVALLLVAWELLNLGGFIWQGVVSPRTPGDGGR
jgi:GT2 family glycosyltransferase